MQKNVRDIKNGVLKNEIFIIIQFMKKPKFKYESNVKENKFWIFCMADVRYGSCPGWRLSGMAVVRYGSCPVWQLSVWQLSVWQLSVWQ